MPGRVPAVGKAAMILRLISGTNTPGYAGYGAGTTAPADGDTGLQTPHTEARQPVTLSRVTGPAPNTANDTMQGVVLITADGAKTAAEVVWFDQVTGGTAWMRATHGAVTLDAAGEAIQYTMQIQLEAV